MAVPTRPTKHWTIFALRRSTHAAAALGTVGHYFPGLSKSRGDQVNIVTGYPGAAEKSTWRCQRGEVQCRAGSLEAISGANRLGRGPGKLRVLVHGAAKRDSRLPDVPCL